MGSGLENFWTQPRTISAVIIVATFLVGMVLVRLSFRLGRARTRATPTCPKCKYNTSNLESLMCPECGFAVKEAGEWSRIPPMRWRAGALGLVGGALLMYVLLMGYFVGSFTLERWRLASLWNKSNDYETTGSWNFLQMSDRAWTESFTPVVWTRVVSARVTNPTDADLRTLAKLSCLEHLRISDRKVSGENLKQLACSQSIRVLWLINTATQDEDVEALALFPALESVGLARTKMSDAGLRKLAKQARPASIQLDIYLEGDKEFSAAVVKEIRSKDAGKVHFVNNYGNFILYYY